MQALPVPPSIETPHLPSFALDTARHRSRKAFIAEASGGTPRIAKVIEYMLAHLHMPLCASELSAIAGVSTSHFFSVFKSATGESPMDFLIRLRMSRACELLRDRSVKVKDVARLIGYDDEFYFSRAFKGMTGLAPSAYRDQFGSEPSSRAPSASMMELAASDSSCRRTLARGTARVPRCA
ncbi:MAG TPA: AraC family transcriptional regulator [Verrucomicrobiae bacterium]|nr:AraC family transcriptional regulator [Verrucomicrobiae bacterium]